MKGNNELILDDNYTGSAAGADQVISYLFARKVSTALLIGK